MAYSRKLTLTVEPADVPIGKRTVAPADLRYLGGFRLPNWVRDAAGRQHSTGYSAGLFALRRLNGQLRAFSSANYDAPADSSIYEVTVPELTSPMKMASTVRYWGNIYGGKRKDRDGNTIQGNPYVTGLRWDEELGGLLWNYGKFYAMETVYQHAPTLGLSRLNESDGTATATGPWRVTKDGQPLVIHLSRGGTVRIPQDFANAFTGGDTLGIGFGGPYSGIAGASAGPCLRTIPDWKEPGDIPCRTVLDHSPWPQHSPLEFRRARRPDDYTVSFPDYLGVQGGYWSGMDEIGSNQRAGACHWMDTPTLEGLMFWSNQATGWVRYRETGGGVDIGGSIERLYVYPTSELMAVGRGEKKAWEAVPTWYDWTHPAGTNRLAKVAGVAFDAVDSRLYLCCVKAWASGVEQYPAVFVYQV